MINKLTHFILALVVVSIGLFILFDQIIMPTYIRKDSTIMVMDIKGKQLDRAMIELESEGFKDILTFNFEIWEKEGGKTSTITRHLASEAQTHVDSMKDVSNTEDWEVLHVKGTSSVPLIDLINDFSLISEGDVLYCGNGHKSMAAGSFMATKGVNVSDIMGGLSAMLVDAPDLKI